MYKPSLKELRECANFGILPSRMRLWIKKYEQDGEGNWVCTAQYNNQDLNSIITRLTNEAFMYRERYKIVDCEGYLEYLPTRGTL